MIQKSILLQELHLGANAVDECTAMSAVRSPVSSFYRKMPNRVYCQVQDDHRLRWCRSQICYIFCYEVLIGFIVRVAG